MLFLIQGAADAATTQLLLVRSALSSGRNQGHNNGPQNCQDNIADSIRNGDPEYGGLAFRDVAAAGYSSVHGHGSGKRTTDDNWVHL